MNPLHTIIEQKKKEFWKPVKGYKGYYEVSNLGRVKSLDRKVNSKKGMPKRKILGRMLKLKPNFKGYLYAEISRYGDWKQKNVHRLVAVAFIPNPKKSPWVNHKNSIRHDNRVENLEWCTPQENYDHSISLGNRRQYPSKLYREILKEKIKKLGHQQKDNTIWVERDKVLALIENKQLIKL